MSFFTQTNKKKPVDHIGDNALLEHFSGGFLSSSALNYRFSASTDQGISLVQLITGVPAK